MHGVVSGPCKSVDRLLNSSRDHYGLHQGKHCHSDHEGRGPQKTYFESYIIHYTWSNGFCGKRGALVEKGKGPWHKSIIIFKILMIFFW